MAYSTVQRVALASGLVLAVSLLLPKAFLSRGKRQEPPPLTEGYPEETYPIYGLSDCIKRRQETILVDYPDPEEPSAEEIAERMGVIEEEGSGHLGWEMPTDPRAQEDNSVTSCDPEAETCSCCFHEEEDPAVLAENAGFGADSYREQEETTEEMWPRDSRDEGPGASADKADGGMLRKRDPHRLEY
uniref:RIC3 acetylcholine receptor chaperone n=1 Tax=Monodon monoceros TaxID=40151 RepID=A0A8C6CGG8_MONMO